MRIYALMLGLSLAAHLHCAVSAAETTKIYVSTQGDDSSSGSIEHPVRSLHRAAELARRSRLENDQAVEVLVNAGEYLFEKPLLLTAQDSGSFDSPVVYRAVGGQVTLSGAVKPERIGLATQWEDYYSQLPADIAEHVVVYEAPVDEDSWKIFSRGELHSLQPNSLQLFANGHDLPQAGFPNLGWSTASERDNLAKALERSSRDSNAWIHGFPTNDYQDEFLRLSDTAPGAWRANSRFRVINSLRELDQQGEWYLDAINNRILYWPNSQDALALRVSNLETIISMYDVESVSIEGFVIEGARVHAVEIAGGYDCQVRNCLVRCVGNVGINVFHGEAHSIVDCEVHSVGSTAIRIEGGNRAGRIPANHTCRSNKVHHCGTLNLARHAAIAAFGVGISVENNLISQQPDWAISVWGDDNIVRANLVYEACQETSDSGAIYLFDNSGYQGNLISHNHIHHIGGFSSRDTFGVYLDNQSSRNELYANLVHHTPRAIVVRGGSANKILANVLHDCWVGVQFQWSVDSVDNQLATNIIDSGKPILVSELKSGALFKENNIAAIEELFVDARGGDLRIANQILANDLSLTEDNFDLIPFEFEKEQVDSAGTAQMFTTE